MQRLLQCKRYSQATEPVADKCVDNQWASQRLRRGQHGEADGRLELPVSDDIGAQIHDDLVRADLSGRHLLALVRMDREPTLAGSALPRESVSVSATERPTHR